MHRYLTGVAKPEVKRKVEKRERDTLYDQQKRQRGYLKVWERDHTWLSYDDDNDLMFCKVCRTHNVTGVRGKNAFLIGTDNFRPDSLRAHTDTVQARRTHELSSGKLRSKPVPALHLPTEPSKR